MARAPPAEASPQTALAGLENCNLDPLDLVYGTKIGQGVSAEVFEGTLHMEAVFGGEIPVAIKRSTKDWKQMHSKMKEGISRELQILARVKHENLLHMYGVVLVEKVEIVTELCKGGTMFELLHNRDDIHVAWAQQLKICSDTADGMAYLHSLTPPIIHRDLKSLNLLLKEEVKDNNDVPQIKVCDFGLSRLKDDVQQMTLNVGTCNWTAPELLTSGKEDYTEKVDIYSYSMIMFEVIAREVPFEDEHDSTEVIKQVKLGNRPDLDAIPPDCPPPLQVLMEECWRDNPNARPDFNRIRECLLSIRNSM